MRNKYIYDINGDSMMGLRFVLQRVGVLLGVFVMMGCSWSLQAQQPEGSWQMVGAGYYDVAVRGDRVLVVGQYGAVMRSTDGGERWELPYSGTYFDLLAVGFFDDDVAVAVGNGWTILRSVDGGSTWAQVEVADSSYRSMSLTSSGVGYITTGSGHVLRSTDRGTTWGRVGRVPGRVRLGYTVKFVDAAKGVVVADSGRIYRTSDSGSTWELVYADTSKMLGSVAFADGRHGVVVGWNREVLRTSDGGQTWQPVESPVVGMNVVSVSMPDTSTIVMVGLYDLAFPNTGYVMARSFDGGKTWRTGWPEGLWTLGYIQFIGVGSGSGKLFAVGNLGVILRSEDVGERWKVISNAQLDFPVYGQAGLSGIAFADERVGVIPNDFLGTGGVLRTTDGGITWGLRRVYNTGMMEPRFISPTRGVAGWDRSGYRYETVDTGKTWVLVEVKDDPDYERTWAVKWYDNDLAFKGGDSLAYRTTDGGKTWRGYVVLGSDIVKGFHILSPSTIFCIAGLTDHTKVYRSDDSGRTWRMLMQRAEASSVLMAVAFVDGKTGIVTAQENARKDLGAAKFFRTTDGGETWDSLFVWDGIPLDVQFFSKDNGIAVGAYGSIFVTRDGGRTWAYDGTTRQVPGFGRLPFEGCTLLPDRRTVIAYGYGCIARKVFPQALSGVDDWAGSDKSPLPFAVFPNPVDDDDMTVRLDASVTVRGMRLSVVDVLGRVVVDLTGAVRYDGTGAVARMSRGVLSAGAYFVVLRSGGRSWTSTIVVR